VWGDEFVGSCWQKNIVAYWPRLIFNGTLHAANCIVGEVYRRYTILTCILQYFHVALLAKRMQSHILLHQFKQANIFPLTVMA